MKPKLKLSLYQSSPLSKRPLWAALLCLALLAWTGVAGAQQPIRIALCAYDDETPTLMKLL